MITTFYGFNDNQTNLLNPEPETILSEYMESFTPKICILEAYWNDNMTDSFSVKPYLQAIGWMLEKEIVIAHRTIATGSDLDHYVKYPDGIVWKDSKMAGIDVFYLAAHGAPGILKTFVADIESSELISAFSGVDRCFNIVYFSSCEVFNGAEGKQFAKEFLRKTGVAAVIGYTEMTSFIDGMIIDTLFLSRFFDTDGNRFDKLQEIYDSVIQDYPRAKECGFSIFINEKPKETQTRPPTDTYKGRKS